MLNQIWQATRVHQIEAAATKFSQYLQKAKTPNQVFRMLDGFLAMTQQAMLMQAQMRSDRMLRAMERMTFAYGSLNLNTVSVERDSEPMTFQMLWQAADPTAAKAAKAGVQAFWGGFPDAASQQTLINFQAGLVEQIQSKDLLGAEAAQDPVQVHNAIALGSYMVLPQLPQPNAGFGRAPIDPTLPLPLTFPPSEGTLFPELERLPEFRRSPWSTFNYPSGVPKSYPYALIWKVTVPVFCIWIALYQNKFEQPNAVYERYYLSHGGIELIEIEEEWPQRLTVAYIDRDSVHQLDQQWTVNGTLYNWTGMFWNREYGKGSIQLVGPVLPNTPLPPGISSTGGSEEPPPPPTPKDNRPDPYAQRPLPSDPPDYRSGESGLVGPLTPDPPGTKRHPLRTGGDTVLPDLALPRFEDSPYKFGESDRNPPPGGTCESKPLPAPLSQMSYLDVLVEALRRALCMVTEEIKNTLEAILNEPTTIAGFAIVLAVMVFVGPWLGWLLAALGTMEDIDQLIQGLKNVIAAKEEEDIESLNTAAHNFSNLIVSLGSDKLLQGLAFMRNGFQRIFAIAPRIPGMPGRFLGQINEDLPLSRMALDNADWLRKHPSVVEVLDQVNLKAVTELVLKGGKKEIETLDEILKLPGVSQDELAKGFSQLYKAKGNKKAVKLTMEEWKKGLEAGFSITEVTLLARHGFQPKSAGWTRQLPNDTLTASKDGQGLWEIKLSGSQNKLVKEHTIAPYGQKTSSGTDSFFQDHHIVQEEWAEVRLGENYSKFDAPTITLRDSLDESPHRIITNRQKRRETGRMNRTYMEERNLAIQDLTEAGVPQNVIDQALQQNDAYYRQIWNSMSPPERNANFGDVSPLNW